MILFATRLIPKEQWFHCAIPSLAGSGGILLRLAAVVEGSRMAPDHAFAPLCSARTPKKKHWADVGHILQEHGPLPGVEHKTATTVINYLIAPDRQAASMLGLCSSSCCSEPRGPMVTTFATDASCTSHLSSYVREVRDRSKYWCPGLPCVCRFSSSEPLLRHLQPTLMLQVVWPLNVGPRSFRHYNLA